MGGPDGSLNSGIDPDGNLPSDPRLRARRGVRGRSNRGEERGRIRPQQRSTGATDSVPRAPQIMAGAGDSGAAHSGVANSRSAARCLRIQGRFSDRAGIKQAAAHLHRRALPGRPPVQDAGEDRRLSRLWRPNIWIIEPKTRSGWNASPWEWQAATRFEVNRHPRFSRAGGVVRVDGLTRFHPTLPAGIG